jgi:porin
MNGKTLLFLTLLGTGIAAADGESAQPAFGGTLASRSKLSGDWLGFRERLRDRGVTLDVDFLSIGQGVNSGGANRNWEYNGEAFFDLNVDSGKLGLWPGGFLRVFAESRFGDSVNLDTGALIPANTAALFPVPGREITTLTSIQFTQFLAEWFGLFGGKLETTSNADLNEFASGRGKTQFMNIAFTFNPVAFATIPYATWGGGLVFLLPDQRGQLTFSVVDPNGKAEKAGFSDAFDNGIAFAVEGRIKTDFFGLPGHQLLGATGSTKDFTALNQDPRLLLQEFIATGQANPKTNNGSWSVFYNFDQYLFTEQDDSTQGVGVFARFGAAESASNPIQRFYSLGIGGKGIIPGRDRDTFGIGFYYTERSRFFGNSRLADLVDRQFGDGTGGEIYYNVAVAPWLHVTPDLQVISASRKSFDPAVVTGIRLLLNF